MHYLIVKRKKDCDSAVSTLWNWHIVATQSATIIRHTKSRLTWSYRLNCQLSILPFNPPVGFFRTALDGEKKLPAGLGCRELKPFRCSPKSHLLIWMEMEPEADPK